MSASARRRWLAAAALAIVFFAALAWGGDSEAERATMRAAAAWGRGAEPFLIAITRLGNAVLLFPIALLLAAHLAVRRGWRVAGLYLAGALVFRLAVEAAKLQVDRARPEIVTHLDVVWSKSFPSAHAANTAAVAIAYALLLGGRVPLSLALAFTGVVGLTRVVLGVHWPSDVLGGWCLGALGAIAIGGAARRLPSGLHRSG